MTDSDGEQEDTDPCTFCGLSLPTSDTNDELTGPIVDGSSVYCSTHCQSQAESDATPLTDYGVDEWMPTDVDALDGVLPRGIPRDSCILISHEPGTRADAVRTELLWRTLQRGEPAVLVALNDPPEKLVRLFIANDWNIIPYLEAGQLRVLDCYSNLVTESERVTVSRNTQPTTPWQTHLADLVEEVTEPVYEPTHLQCLFRKVHATLDDLNMSGQGLVCLDSLDELGTHLGSARAYQFARRFRAAVCKPRSVPVIAEALYEGYQDEFPHDLEGLFDGVIDLQLNPNHTEDTLIKEVAIRKMKGVDVIRRYRPYDVLPSRGVVALADLDTSPLDTTQDEKEGTDEDTAE